jgi:hypothetical protein
MNDWNIQSRAHACQGCAQSFRDQQPYHTALFDLKHEIQRLDLCEACWQQDHGDGTRDRKGFVSHWQGIYEVPPAAPPEAIRKENAETLLRKIMELNDPKHATVSYILAAKLERQRVLKVKEQFQRDGRRFFVYEHSKTAEVFTIADPALQLNQLDQVQREVAALLDHGLNPPAAPLAEALSVAGEMPLEAGTLPGPQEPADPAPAASIQPEPLAH